MINFILKEPLYQILFGAFIGTMGSAIVSLILYFLSGSQLQREAGEIKKYSAKIEEDAEKINNAIKAIMSMLSHVFPKYRFIDEDGNKIDIEEHVKKGWQPTSLTVTQIQVDGKPAMALQADAEDFYFISIEKINKEK